VAKAPNIKRLLLEDFPEQSDWIEKLILTINQLSVTIATALNRGLTLRDNLQVGYIELSIDLSQPTMLPLQVKHGLASVWGLQMVYAFCSSGDQTLIRDTSVVWEDLGDGRLLINALPGLTLGQKYNLRFLALPR